MHRDCTGVGKPGVHCIACFGIGASTRTVWSPSDRLAQTTDKHEKKSIKTPNFIIVCNI